MKEQNCNHDNRHVENVAAAKIKPLYGECLWGFPYGRAPEGGCYETSLTREENPITVDPANPLAKTLLADLGYSTQVFFNACCKPPHVLDSHKVAQNLPFSLQPSSLSDSTLKFYLVMIAISSDPSAIFEAIPEGTGPVIATTAPSGQTMQKKIFAPITLSQYWSLLMDFAVEKLACCENFISASPPSSPCLVCHPFVRNPTPPLSPATGSTPGGFPAPSPRPSATSDQPPAKKRCDGEGHPLMTLQKTSPTTSTAAATVAATTATAAAGSPSPSMVIATLFPSSSLSSPSSVSLSSSLSASTPSSSTLHSIPTQSADHPFMMKNFPLAPPAHPSAAMSRMMFIIRGHKGGLVPFPGQTPVLSPPTNAPSIPRWPPTLPYPSPQGLPSSPPIQLQMSQSSTAGSTGHFAAVDRLATQQSALLTPPPTSHARILPTAKDTAQQQQQHVVQSLSGVMQSNGQNSSSLQIPGPLSVMSGVLPSKGLLTSQPSTEWRGSMSPPTPQPVLSSEEGEGVGRGGKEDKGRVEEQEEDSTDLDQVVPTTRPPTEWTVEEVKHFVTKVADPRIAQVFHDQEVDGQAMLLLTTDVMVNMMKVKIGPALKLMSFIDALKEKFGS